MHVVGAPVDLSYRPIPLHAGWGFLQCPHAAELVSQYHVCDVAADQRHRYSHRPVEQRGPESRVASDAVERISMPAMPPTASIPLGGGVDAPSAPMYAMPGTGKLGDRVDPAGQLRCSLLVRACEHGLPAARSAARRGSRPREQGHEEAPRASEQAGH
jgi:hypothetical protein